jgi:Uma2 family endonuclease
LERNVGKWEHARVQALLAIWFGSQEKVWSVKVATEQRLQVSTARIRIPDLMLVSRGPQPDVTVNPPVLVVEILSPDDTYTDTQSRSADYLNMGVQAVWIIDPASRTGRQCIGDAWIAGEMLEVPGTSIGVNLSTLFADLDED